VFAGALALALLAAGLYLIGVARIQMTVSPKEAVSATVAGDPRHRIWGLALERIAEHPIVGAGFGRGSRREEFRTEIGGAIYWHAHNVVLNYGMSLGVPGIVLILALFGVPLVRLVRAARDAPSDLRRYAIAAAVMVVGVFVKNQFDDLFYRQTAFFYWAVIGMVLGACARSDQVPTPPQRSG
jgi:O-antigen ligase